MIWRPFMPDTPFDGWGWAGLPALLLTVPSLVVSRLCDIVLARTNSAYIPGGAAWTVHVLIVAASALLYAGGVALVARLWRHYMGEQPARGTRVSSKDANILTGLLLAVGLVLLIVAIGTAMGLSERRPQM